MITPFQKKKKKKKKKTKKKKKKKKKKKQCQEIVPIVTTCKTGRKDHNRYEHGKSHHRIT